MYFNLRMLRIDKIFHKTNLRIKQALVLIKKYNILTVNSDILKNTGK